MEILKNYGMIGRYHVQEVVWTREEAKTLQGAAISDRPVLDIRVYEGQTPKHGISFTDDMLTNMIVLLSRLKVEEDPTKLPSAKKGKYKNVEYEIHKIYGTLLEGKNYNVIFSRTSFGTNGMKYDIRPWTKDLSCFMLGVSFTAQEFGDTFTEILMKVDADRKLTFPKMLPQTHEDDVAKACFAELVYQFDKMGVCFGKEKEKAFAAFFEETKEFMRSWPKGKPLYVADRN